MALKKSGCGGRGTGTCTGFHRLGRKAVKFHPTLSEAFNYPPVENTLHVVQSNPLNESPDNGSIFAGQNHGTIKRI